MRLSATMLLLTVVLAAFASASARSSPQCPKGCIIASVVHPKRVCKCVVPQCHVPEEEQQQVEQGLKAAASTSRRRQIRRPRLAAVDCDFCNRAPNTYARCAVYAEQRVQQHNGMAGLVLLSAS